MIGVLVFCSTATTNFLLKVEFKNALLTILALTQAVTLYEISDTFRKNPSWYWQKSVPDVNVVFFLGTISFVIFLYNVIFFRPIEQKA
jgi:hypothetical protein